MSELRRCTVDGDKFANRHDPLLGKDHDLISNSRWLSMVDMHDGTGAEAAVLLGDPQGKDRARE